MGKCSLYQIFFCLKFFSAFISKFSILIYFQNKKFDKNDCNQWILSSNLAFLMIHTPACVCTCMQWCMYFSVCVYLSRHVLMPMDGYMQINVKKFFFNYCLMYNIHYILELFLNIKTTHLVVMVTSVYSKSFLSSREHRNHLNYIVWRATWEYENIIKIQNIPSLTGCVSISMESGIIELNSNSNLVSSA